MKAIKLFAIMLLLVGCTPEEEEQANNCNCGTITKVTPNSVNNPTQWEYELTNDCGTVTTYESRYEIVEVGFRKCN